MYKNVPKTLQTKIKKAAEAINKHNCAVDTMLINHNLNRRKRNTAK